MNITEEQQQALGLAVASIEREFGKGSIMRLDSAAVEMWPAISTGAITLDRALGIGGLPIGRIVEIYGRNGSGKSSIALSTVACAQERGMACAYIDSENALDPAYMKSLGVNLDELYLSQPDYGEQALSIVQKLVNTHAMSVIVVDSVATLVPKAELEGNIGDSHMGLQARMMSQALRMLNGSIADSTCLVIFINQVREKIGIVYGNPITTTGGNALPFYSSVRIEVSRKEDLKAKSGEFSGVKIKAKVVKNKLAPALRVAEYDILYGRGIDWMGCVVDSAEALGVLTRKGAWYSYGEQANLAQGRDNMVQYLASDLDFAQSLKDIILQHD